MWLSHSLCEVCECVCVCAHRGFLFFFFLRVHARSNVMFSCVKAHILASQARLGIPVEKTPDGRCCSLMATEFSPQKNQTITPTQLNLCATYSNIAAIENKNRRNFSLNSACVETSTGKSIHLQQRRWAVKLTETLISIPNASDMVGRCCL